MVIIIGIKKVKKSSLGRICPECKRTLMVASGKMLEITIFNSNERSSLRVSTLICKDCLINKIEGV